jgi:sugar phosphate isomerase/epimerase
MELLLFRSHWGAPPDLEAMIAQTIAGEFNGIELTAPRDPIERRRLGERCRQAGLRVILEVSTGISDRPTYDWWIPEPSFTVQDHLEDLRRATEAVDDLQPLFITTMCGYDAWSFQQNVDFFGMALDLEASSGVPISFETHRSRSMFNPWVTRDLIDRYPRMKLTCDFSHWCVVAERVVDTEIEIIRKCAKQAHHIHCRVGWAQHAQVSDPAAPEFQSALESHERWWTLIWESRRARGLKQVTMNCEFGPDGYLPTLPYTQAPVADLWSIICWMRQRQKARFADWIANPNP